MRNARLLSHSAGLLIGAALALAPLQASQAGQTRQGHAITVAANDGYGLQDCLGEGGDCGQAVADAWCASENRGAALSFGKAENAASGGYVVTCGD